MLTVKLTSGAGVNGWRCPFFLIPLKSDLIVEFEPELGRQSGGQHSTTHHQTDVCLVISPYEPYSTGLVEWLVRAGSLVSPVLSGTVLSLELEGDHLI